MDLTTTYLGMKLKNPLVASASPLSESVDNIAKLEDKGIAAVVMHSLFEEQLVLEARELNRHLTAGTESYAESLSYFPELSHFVVGPEEYLDHIRKAKRRVKVPLIASLNGCSSGGWTKYARNLQEAGADALELNIYFLAAKADTEGAAVEEEYIRILKAVKQNVDIPVAVKLSPFFSSMANMAKRLDEAGAGALVLFNRFYQPDIDLETLDVVPNVILSTPQATRLPMRWIAILHGRLKADLAATGGIHTAEDVLKMLMVGADVTMLCSTLLRNGVDQVGVILEGMERWMQEHGYTSVRQMRGSMSQKSCADPAAFERANYMKALQTYRKPL
ncbi:MAG TPA: dihydroorotate dehydrogenase-like protein [Candidatus Omnitrophica bacterium]|nr:MAG: dihydroorotate dehydrogenase [Omnitrophica WOR_2 bacterium GWA2_53_43]HCI44404.1 dihydroorotate dehydrogenase-like protein [Candidatus Omnitrophota bacterium]